MTHAPPSSGFAPAAVRTGQRSRQSNTQAATEGRLSTLPLSYPTASELPELLRFLTPRERAELDRLLCDPRDPCVYAASVLGVHWWSKQQEIANALMRHKRVLVKASHGVGKTHLAAGLVNWHYDLFDPGETLTTAPTVRQVTDVLWKEVRRQRKGRQGLLPKEPRMESSADHYALGYTASDSESFQGRHSDRMLIVFDECVGVEAGFWNASEGMMSGGQSAYHLAICNPTDTSSRAYEEEQKGKFHVMTISALDHPNIAAELAGEPAPYPNAVRLQWVQDRVREWCEPLAQGDHQAGDIEWPPQSGKWHRPGPLFESRVLGRWPSQGSTSVWTEAIWEYAIKQQAIPEEPVEIGCDVARFGDDYTTIIVRRGACALHHETHNGWDTARTAGRLKQLCGQYAGEGEDPRRVCVKIDDDGVGGGVTDQADGYRFFGCSGANRALEPAGYPNRRSEVWFVGAQLAGDNRMDLSRLSDDVRLLLRRQAMAPTWKVDSQGRRVVEPKGDTKKRLGRSPDDMDALNLAYAGALGGVSHVAALYE